MANNLTRFDPFGELTRFDTFRGFEDLFKNFTGLTVPTDNTSEARIRLDVSETDDAYAVRAEMPGVKKDDVKITIDGNKVAIRAESRSETEEKEGETVLRRERFYGVQSRSFVLANEIDDASATAKYEDGILTLHLPKKASGSGAKTLSIE